MIDEIDVPTARPGRAVRVRVRSVRADGVVDRDDWVVTEEPLEIRLAAAGQSSASQAVTMRTPGHDFELAAGWLYSEGLIHAGSVHQIRYCADVAREDQRYNVVTVTLRPGEVPVGMSAKQPLVMTAACGVCGKESLEALERKGIAQVGPGPRVERDTVLSLPSSARAGQKLFERTGGLHAAALFSPEGGLILLREDVGRHNAVDKIVGERLLCGALPLSEMLLYVSGRPGFEIVQKAATAGIPILAGVSAPSSLAVATAEKFGLTLIGFLRDDRFNVYTGIDRIAG